MRLLAFDTAGPAISAATGEGGSVLSSRREILTRGHAERLLPLLQEMLAQADWTWRDIDLVVVTEGPGNFTGLRAGVAVARALALALDRPVLGIGTLELLAEAGAAAVPDNPLPILAVIDARREELYAQRFSPDLGPITGPYLVSLSSPDLGPSPCLVVGDVAAGVALRGARDDRVIEAGLDARYLVRAAWRRLAGDAVGGPGAMVRPVYLRLPDARMGAGTSMLAARH